ncbi:MAG: hypothetical protein ACYTDW_21445 [Planctomycetota bacterium]
MVEVKEFDANRVRKERLGWRDEWMSKHHRTLGFDAPCFDIDCVEWRYGKPVAIIEWKYAYDMNEKYLANIYEKSGFSLRCQADIAKRLGIPSFLLFYNRKGTYWLFNNHGFKLAFIEQMNEERWFEWNRQEKFE